MKTNYTLKWVQHLLTPDLTIKLYESMSKIAKLSELGFELLLRSEYSLI